MSTLSGPTLSSAGIGSGLDVNSIVTALVKAESQPLVQLQSKAPQIQTTISSWGKVQSYVSAMRDAARALTDPTLWTRTAGSSGSPAVGVTTNGATLPGDYQVEVQALAAAQSAATATTYTDAIWPLLEKRWVRTKVREKRFDIGSGTAKPQGQARA